MALVGKAAVLRDLHQGMLGCMQQLLCALKALAQYKLVGARAGGLAEQAGDVVGAVSGLWIDRTKVLRVVRQYMVLWKHSMLCPTLARILLLHLSWEVNIHARTLFTQPHTTKL